MNTRTIIYVAGALVLGLLAGYFLFGGEAQVMDQHADHDHETMDEGGGEAQIWTCSMHPQIQQGEPGDCPLCGMDLIPLQAGNSTDPSILTMTEAAVAMARVRTVIVGPLAPNGGTTEAENEGVPIAIGTGAGEVERAGLKLTGRLAPDARTAAVEVSEFGGRVERLFVSFAGEQVRAGQRIATVYSPDLVVAQEELLQAKKFADVNPELVAAARTKLLNLEVTEAQIAELEKTGEVISNFPIYADRSGTILETKAEVGEYVKAGGALYTYTNLSNLWALFDAYEQDLAKVRVGDKVSFSVASRPGESYDARVTFIDPVIDPQTRTAAVRAEVRNRGGRLKPEMFIEGTVTASGTTRPTNQGRSSQGSADELVVPRSAVLWTGDRSVAYVELPDMEVPTYEFREITVGERVGDGYRITSGLAAGDRVVVNGAFQIDASAQLNNKASMMNRDVLIQGQESEAPVGEEVPDYREDTPEAFRAQLGKVVEAYLPLKDRMVATESADEALIASLKEALTGVDMTQVKGDAHVYWMQQMEAIEAHANALLKKDDVEAQRGQFGFLSQALINALTAFGVDGIYYVQYCPMAFDNAGANWLSNEEQIRNPYFGDLMMKCGSVTAEL
ncbi:efflux RND transporter periplasmic adaptor subunit [Neolewinella agarilytica]|uniref:Membrane fusion protein, Cu(I)/Ag(I) efflux system n=1 Tax=Neolewinella agarilytica TaxID=478744 RepID=A0A1H9H696_9BACT|nr:efflux RND transporter periplasmic adaptor subunit [Neolewinella agarilytica]SEQ57850.1 membrane fusion protein, Cu(I)/Ag(I) efflux system [Neolewinella agarilytica]